MLRIVIQRHEFDFNSGMERKDLITRDVELPEIEDLLTSGGRGPQGFESFQLVGIEVLPEIKDT